MLNSRSITRIPQSHTITMLPSSIKTSITAKLATATRGRSQTHTLRNVTLNSGIMLPTSPARRPPVFRLINRPNPRRNRNRNAISRTYVLTLRTLRLLLTMRLISVTSNNRIRFTRLIPKRVTRTLVRTTQTRRRSAIGQRTPLHRHLVRNTHVNLLLRNGTKMGLTPRSTNIERHRRTISRRLTTAMRPLNGELSTAFTASRKNPMIHIRINRRHTMLLIIHLPHRRHNNRHVTRKAGTSLRNTTITRRNTNIRTGRVVLRAR